MTLLWTVLGYSVPLIGVQFLRFRYSALIVGIGGVILHFVSLAWLDQLGSPSFNAAAELTIPILMVSAGAIVGAANKALLARAEVATSEWLYWAVTAFFGAMAFVLLLALAGHGAEIVHAP
jgi:hypothetical protein